jgi:hypothetical protein
MSRRQTLFHVADLPLLISRPGYEYDSQTFNVYPSSITNAQSVSHMISDVCVLCIQFCVLCVFNALTNSTYSTLLHISM